MNASRNRSKRTSKTVVILGGGAAFGAHQAGALEYLVESGIKPDAIIGSSVGIVNALLYAAGGCELMRKSWLEMNSLRLLIGPSLRHNPMLGNSLMSMGRMVSWIESVVDFKRVYKSPVELAFVLLNLSDGRAYLRGNRTEKNAEDFRMVSHIGYRIPLLYPPIKFKGDYWCDGGFVWNIPLEHAVQMGAKNIYVLSVIPPHLPRQATLPTLAHVGYRMMEVMWATMGNSTRLRARIQGGKYQGVRIYDVQPSEYFGANPISILLGYPKKSKRLLEMGREDARHALSSVGEKLVIESREMAGVEGRG
jgi:NTE family protein